MGLFCFEKKKAVLKNKTKMEDNILFKFWWVMKNIGLQSGNLLSLFRNKLPSFVERLPRISLAIGIARHFIDAAGEVRVARCELRVNAGRLLKSLDK